VDLTERTVGDGPVADGPVADRVALRHLVDSYARYVDRRDADAVAGLFTTDGRLVSHMNGGAGAAPIERRGRADIAAALVAGLGRYLCTTHIVGGQVVHVDGDRATGETTCLAHHLYERDTGRRMLVLAVRYEDTFVRGAGSWAFDRRELRLDWRDDRPSDAR
jgi:hypothetical protein